MGKEGGDLRTGKLFVVSTPIGNLEDITLRALRILGDVQLIAAENREHTKKLCSHYSIKTPITSYNSHNKRFKGLQLVEKIKCGINIALVSDAGTPCLSDPGFKLVQEAIEESITVVPVPGVSACLAALSVSGLRTDRFVFIGFLSNKGGRRRKELKKLQTESKTMIFFESPHRLIRMLEDMNDILGDRKIALGKEITKVFENFKRASISEVLASIRNEVIRGEYTIVVEGVHGDDK
jgi:16S rRNA (cytidine1402-2'-O)-methyltransferase